MNNYFYHSLSKIIILGECHFLFNYVPLLAVCPLGEQLRRAWQTEINRKRRARNLVRLLTNVNHFSTRMGTNATDTYEDHCYELEHPEEKEGSGDEDGEEGDENGKKFSKSACEIQHGGNRLSKRFSSQFTKSSKSHALQLRHCPSRMMVTKCSPNLLHNLFPQIVCITMGQIISDFYSR